MAKTNVLLINLPVGGWFRDALASSNSMHPLGLLYIASTLLQNGYSVKVVDLAVEKFSDDEIRRYVKLYQPSIIGMSTYNESWNVQRSVCSLIKSEFSDVLVVAGGAFATFCYSDILLKTSTDYVFRGEGEYLFLDFCNLFFHSSDFVEKVKELKGICYLDKDMVVHENGLPDRIRNIDALPFPARNLLKNEKYLLPYTISTSRGCPGECIFCSSKAFWGKKVFLRSALNIYEEVLCLRNEFNARYFNIVDDTFTISVNRCMEFCKLLLKSGLDFSWGCESRADVINEEIIKTMKEAGCNKIQFGFESADNSILARIKKNVTIEQIENAIMLAHKYDMYIQASYIIGHAFDTEETIVKTINFAEYLKDTYGVRVACSVNTPFPGTEQYEKANAYGIDIKSDDWSQYMLTAPIISTEGVSINKLRYYLDRAQRLMV